MIHKIPLKYLKFHKSTLTVRYIAALSIVALLAIAGQVIIQLVLERQGVDAKITNAAIKQTILLQNMSKTALSLQLSSTIQDRQRLLDDLNSITSQVGQIHLGFQKGDKSLGIAPLQSSETKNILNEIDPHFQTILRTLGSQDVKIDNFTKYQTIVAESSLYRLGMNRIVLQFETESSKKVLRLKRVELLLLGLMLSVLMFEGLFVFRPAVKRLNYVLSELEASEARAVEALRVRADFIGKMSHEIRNPLNAIMGMTGLLSETTLDIDQKRYSQILRRASGTLLNLINDILDFSKIEAGRLDLEHTDFDLHEVIERSIDLITPRADEKKLELILDISQEVPTRLNGDPKRLQQVFLNLLSNAVKFTFKGEVILRVQGDPSAKNTLIFSVIDTGIGIEDDKRIAIFNSFVQGDSSVSRKFGGTGLGLSIAKQIVEAMNGNIWVDSKKGQGSHFFLKIPFEVQSKQVNAKLSLQGLKVSAKISNPSTLSAVQNILSFYKVDVETLDCELTDTQVAEADRILLVDGRVALAGIQRKAFAGKIILLLTTTNAAEDIVYGRNLGVTDYIFKPIKARELLDVLLGIRNKIDVNTNVKGVDSIALANGNGIDAVAPAILHPLDILVVDDSEDNRELILAYFKNTPYRAHTAENGQVAFDKFKAGRFDLVLMDIQMPIMDGHTAIRKIRSFEKAERRIPTPIVTLTAYDQKEEVKKSFDAGCDHNLIKPVKCRDLLGAIKTCTVPGRYQVSRLVVRIDQQLGELVPRYLENRKAESKVLQKALADFDFITIETIAHKIKGNAASFGFDCLSELGASLERAAQQKDTHTLALLIKDFEFKLETIELV